MALLLWAGAKTCMEIPEQHIPEFFKQLFCRDSPTSECSAAYRLPRVALPLRAQHNSCMGKPKEHARETICVRGNSPKARLDRDGISHWPGNLAPEGQKTKAAWEDPKQQMPDYP